MTRKKWYESYNNDIEYLLDNLECLCSDFNISDKEYFKKCLLEYGVLEYSIEEYNRHKKQEKYIDRIIRDCSRDYSIEEYNRHKKVKNIKSKPQKKELTLADSKWLWDEIHKGPEIDIAKSQLERPNSFFDLTAEDKRKYEEYLLQQNRLRSKTAGKQFEQEKQLSTIESTLTGPRRVIHEQLNSVKYKLYITSGAQEYLDYIGLAIIPDSKYMKTLAQLIFDELGEKDYKRFLIRASDIEVAKRPIAEKIVFGISKFSITPLGRIEDVDFMSPIDLASCILYILRVKHNQ